LQDAWSPSHFVIFVGRFDCFPEWVGGLEHSVGHYLDFALAVSGVSLFCVGYFFHALFSQ
jgi:hypothetical protein